MSVFKVGSNVDAWCTRCKLVLAHTIEAIAQGVLKRVQCNTCRGQHQYKPAPPGTKSTVASSSMPIKAKNPPKTKSLASQFERMVSGKDMAKARTYKSSSQFVKGELINHVQFGMGVVVEEKDASKVEVLFSSGAKILVQGRSQ